MREAYERIVEGRAVDVGFLYDSVEAHPKTPLTPESLRVAIPKIRGDATWLNVETIIQSVLDPTMSASRSRRMWLNQIVADEDALYAPADWSDLADENLILEPGDEIVMGFDGGKTDDDTALVAIRVKDCAVFVLGHWFKPDGPRGDGWEVDRIAVDDTVRDAFRLYAVKAFFADVALWESYIADWESDFGESLVVKAEGHKAISWDMRSSLQRVTRAHERLVRTILDKKIKYDGNRSLLRHALNARRRENNYGVSFGKESRESPRKVDLYAALMLAYEALTALRTRGKKERVRSGRSYWF